MAWGLDQDGAPGTGRWGGRAGGGRAEPPRGGRGGGGGRDDPLLPSGLRIWGADRRPQTHEPAPCDQQVDPLEALCPYLVPFESRAPLPLHGHLPSGTRDTGCFSVTPAPPPPRCPLTAAGPFLGLQVAVCPPCTPLPSVKNQARTLDPRLWGEGRGNPGPRGAPSALGLKTHTASEN